MLSQKDPDFKKVPAVLDVRALVAKGLPEMPDFAETNAELVEEAETPSATPGTESRSSGKEIPVRYEELSDYTGGVVLSPAIAQRGKDERRKALEEDVLPDFQKALLEGLRAVLKALTVSFAFLWQKADSALRALKYGGIDFDTRFTDEQLFYIAISTPETVRTADDLLSLYPLMSAKHRYRILQIRKEKIAMFRRIFKRKS